MRVAIVAGKNFEAEAVKALILRMPAGTKLLIEEKSPALELVRAAAAEKGHTVEPFKQKRDDPSSWYHNRKYMIERSDFVHMSGTGTDVDHARQVATETKKLEEIHGRVAIVADKNFPIEKISAFVAQQPARTQIMVETGLVGRDSVEKLATELNLSFRAYGPSWTTKGEGKVAGKVDVPVEGEVKEEIRKNAGFDNRERMIVRADRVQLFGEGPAVREAAAVARREEKPFAGLDPAKAVEPEKDQYRIKRVTGQEHIAELQFRMPREKAGNTKFVAAVLDRRLPTAKELGLTSQGLSVVPEGKDSAMVVMRIPSSAEGRMEKLLSEARGYFPPKDKEQEQAKAPTSSRSEAAPALPAGLAQSAPQVDGRSVAVQEPGR